MANGVRIKRQGGFEQTDSFRNLMKLLQAGSGIAQTVQQNRNRRDAYHTDYLNALTRGINTNFQNSGPGGAQQILDKLNNYRKTRMTKSSPEMLELLDIAKMNVENQIAENTDYLTKKGLMQDQQFAAQKILSDIYTYQNPNTSGDIKNKMLDGMTEEAYLSGLETKLKDEMYGFSENFNSYYTRHADRLSNAEVDNLNVSRQYLKSALDAFKDDGKIDETEYKFYYDGIMQGNANELANFRNERSLNRKNLIEQNYKDFNANKDTYNILNDAVKENQISYSNALKFLPEGYVNAPGADSMDMGFGDEKSTTQLGSMPIQLNAAQSGYIKNKLLNDYRNRLESTDKILMGLGQKSSLPDDFFVAKSSDTITTDSELKGQPSVKQGKIEKSVFLPNQNTSFVGEDNKKSILASVDSNKSKSYNLDKRLDKATNQQNFINEYKFGNDLNNYIDSGTKVSPQGDGAFHSEESKALNSWYVKNYPSNKYVKSEEYIAKGQKALRNALGYGEGGLSYKELKELDEIHTSDLLKYETAMKELEFLQKIGQVPDNIKSYIDGNTILYGPDTEEERGKLEQWEKRILELDDYRQKWRNWKPRGEANRGFITYHGISPNSQKGGRKTIEELKMQLSFFDEQISGIVNTNQKTLNQIISNNPR